MMTNSHDNNSSAVKPCDDLAAMSADIPPDLMRVQVCYGTLAAQPIHAVAVPAGTLLRDAIALSGLLEEFPEIDLNNCRVGIFGKLKTLDAVVRDLDRVEIYRGLTADPMESRRKRAIKKSQD